MIAKSGKAGVDRAVAAASVAFAANRKQPTHQRIAWLNAAADALRKAGEDIASLICEDVGKPIRMARFEVKRGAEFLELTAAALTQLGGETLPLDITAPGAGHIGFVRHVPYGVVAGITLQRAGQFAGAENRARDRRRQRHHRQAGARGNADRPAARATVPRCRLARGSVQRGDR